MAEGIFTINGYLTERKLSNALHKITQDGASAKGVWQPTIAGAS